MSRQTILPPSGSLQSSSTLLCPIFVPVLLTTYVIHKNTSSNNSLNNNRFYTFYDFRAKLSLCVKILKNMADIK